MNVIDDKDPFGFGDLHEDLDNVPTKKASEHTARPFTCESCNGTGVWAGGTNRYGNSKCNTCHGFGRMATSAADRRAKRQAIARNKATKRVEAQADNLEHKELFKWLRENQSWNSFAASLMEQHNSGRRWTDKQVAAASRIMEKTIATRAAKDAAKPTIDLSPIRTMFEAAVENGHKRPTYRAEGLVINRAPDYGANPGALYVKTDDKSYLGKVVGTKYIGRDDALPLLEAIAKNPLEAAVAYGRRTGSCACCGRKLTNATSIDLGIGPICREKWGL